MGEWGECVVRRGEAWENVEEKRYAYRTWCGEKDVLGRPGKIQSPTCTVYSQE